MGFRYYYVTTATGSILSKGGLQHRFLFVAVFGGSAGQVPKLERHVTFAYPRGCLGHQRYMYGDLRGTWFECVLTLSFSSPGILNTGLYPQVPIGLMKIPFCIQPQLGR